MWVFHLLTVLDFQEQIQASLRGGGSILSTGEYFSDCNVRKHSWAAEKVGNLWAAQALIHLAVTLGSYMTFRLC